jgi:hypothetical protein
LLRREELRRAKRKKKKNKRRADQPSSLLYIGGQTRMNYNAEILKGIGYLIGAILQISFPYIVAAVLGYQIAKRVRQRIR